MITKLGEIDEALLSQQHTYTEVNGNKLHKIEWYYQGEMVKDELIVELCQLNLAGEQADIEGSKYPPLLMTNDLVTLSIEDAVQVLHAIYKADPNTCIEMPTNIFYFNKESKTKLDFAGKFYVDGKEARISFLPKNATTLIQ